jgi:hypothetical protein
MGLLSIWADTVTILSTQQTPPWSISFLGMKA